MKLHLRFFASLGEALGPGETLDWQPAGPATPATLRQWLRARSPAAAEALAPDRPVRVAIDQDMARDDTPLHDGAEVAFFPAGHGRLNMAVARARVQQADFDPAAELEGLQGARTDVGALVSFTGCVRAAALHDGVLALTLEHYPGMTERAIESMIEEAQRRFGVVAARVVHRVGRLAPGARIVWVGVAGRHRREAFQACEFLMDYLKTQAPFWKKEATPEGERWVEAQGADDEALARWGIASGNSGAR